MPTLRYRYRFYPNAEQRQMLARQFGCVRYVYNWALALKRDAFRERGEKIGYAETDKRLTALKREPDHAWLNDVSSVPLQQALRHLDKAYTAFFRGTARFPRFKAKKHRQSATYTRRGFSLRDSGVPGQPVVKLAKMRTPLKIRWSRPLPSAPSSLTVVQEPDGKYYISFVVEVDYQPLPKTKREGGIDLGVKDVVVTSDGWRSGNPKHLKRALDRLALEQKRLARKQKGSKNWHKQRRKVAKLHAKVRNQRQDFLHQLSTRLVRRYDTIYTESLCIRGMVKNHSLARAISDAGWSAFVGMLEYKATLYCKRFVQIDRWYPSSKTCSGCNYTMETLPLGVRAWVCPRCGAEHDRDVNAAQNVLAVGQTVAERSFGNACGDGVRPALASVSEGDCR
ncbi:RNA-guided endonuclease InsQ/TnpB family protein [Rhodocaloribacter litoris]|uniref:RNA-guided endonuclease InsQ/TnpB family protein n=1 Tax=Rhodocaloribacter litoris TaxID=2558931 RepID=UPI001421A410|nr:RNA-guided endonuclease TnpB family protein [Rhodocaloribacter litoris]